MLEHRLGAARHPRDASAERGGGRHLEELRASLQRVLGAEDLPFTDATAVRGTVGNSRHADTYRAGRVFLTGDAAHIFNAEGTALYVGLQDAIARLVASRSGSRALARLIESA